MCSRNEKKGIFIQWKSINVKTRKWKNTNVEGSVQMENLTHIFKWNSDEKFLITNWTETDCCNFECIKRSECVDCRMAVENLVLIYIQISPHFPRHVIVIPTLYHSTICKRFAIHTHTQSQSQSPTESQHSVRDVKHSTLENEKKCIPIQQQFPVSSREGGGGLRNRWQMKRICDDIEKW